MRHARGHFEDRRWEANPGAMGGRRNRRAFTYQAFVPDAIAQWTMELRSDAVAAVTEATSAVAHLNQWPPKLQPLEALARQLLRAESVASSRIEGLELSHRRLARAAFRGDGAHDSRAADVLGNIAAMERAIELGAHAGPFTVSDVREIHSALLGFGLDRPIAGVIRTKQSWIGRNPHMPRGADYVPPPPEHVEGLLEDLCAFMSRTDLPAVVQAAVAHAQFETIHPFIDGNGRVGRCLIHAVLRRHGAARTYVPPISLILAARREQYIQGLVDFREGRNDEWLEVFSDATRLASEAAERFADQIARLQQGWAEALGRPRRDSAAHKILAALPAYPVIDVATAQGIAGVSDVAAGRALNAMQDVGILDNLGARQRRRTWECRPLFDLVNDFERDLAAP
ncbi:MAG: Fic family protein [Thermoleophilaceae bacterium]